MPGTMLAGENAACSTSAKKFSGFRFNSKKPTSISGKSAFGQTFVRSNGLNGECLRLGVGHHLNEQRPARKISLLDALEKITLVCFAVLSDQGFGLGVGKVLDALLRPKVELDPDPLVRCVDEAVGVAAKPVHVTKAARDAALAHDDGDLMQRLGQQRPEIPVVVGAAHAGTRVALDRMVEIGKAQRIAKEEDRRVVAHHVPIALLGIEFQSEAANVPFGIGGAALAGDRRESREHRGLLADLREDLGLGVARDVVGHGEGAVRARAFGVHAPLWDDFPVEVGELFDQPDVLQQSRAARPGGLDVDVVADGRWGA